MEPKLKIAGKDGADRRRFLRNHDNLLVGDPVTQRHRSADPDALALGGGDLVPHPLADDLALELGEGQQHIEGEPAHAGGGVERLGYRDERHGVLVEQLDQLGKVGKRAGEPVDLVDHHDVDLAGPDIGQQGLQGRAVQRGARDAAIVIAGQPGAASLRGLGS